MSGYGSWRGCRQRPGVPELARQAQLRAHLPLRSHSRPYEKNDNPHVDQKNGHRFRRLFGFGRFDVQEAVEAMNDVVRLQSLYDNLFRQTLKLQSKTQAGHKYRKKFEREAKTPAQRVLDATGTSYECRRRVRSLLGKTTR